MVYLLSSVGFQSQGSLASALVYLKRDPHENQPDFLPIFKATRQLLCLLQKPCYRVVAAFSNSALSI